MIRNYTSSVPVGRSVMMIEEKLVAFGARHIVKNYGPTGSIDALVFELPVDGKSFAIRLPVNAEKAESILRGECKRISSAKAENIKEQSQRTAWKLLYDWVDLQLAMIQLQQVQPMEVFFAYVFNGKQTLFEVHQQQNFSRLLSAPKD